MKADCKIDVLISRSANTKIMATSLPFPFLLFFCLAYINNRGVVGVGGGLATSYKFNVKFRLFTLIFIQCIGMY